MSKCVSFLLVLAAAVSAGGQLPSTAPSLAERAVATVLHQNIIDPNQYVDGKNKPLSSKGKWSIANAPAEGCAPSTACIKTIYTVPESNVVCAWSVELSQQGTAEGIIIDEDENAEKYLLHVLKPDEATALVSQSAAPIYPPIAKAAHVSGRVELYWKVQKDGRPTNLKVIYGPDMLIGAANDAAGSYTFKPFLLHGRAIAWTSNLVFDFLTTGLNFGTVTFHFVTRKQ